MDIDWDDEELVQPKNESSDDDDLFEFSTSLRIDDDGGAATLPADKDLPPLAPGVEDVLGDRGVLLKRQRSKISTGVSSAYANGKGAASSSGTNGSAAASSSVSSASANGAGSASSTVILATPLPSKDVP
eukprot:IDg4529t1